MESPTEILSTSIVKRSVIEQGRLLKKGNMLGVASFKEATSHKCLYQNYELQIMS